MTALFTEVKSNLQVRDNYLYLNNEPYSGELRKEEDYGYSISHYCNGFVHGLYKAYYSTGRLKDVCLYQNGILSGRSIKYWPNGVKKMNVNYLNGEMNGVYEEWNEQGILVCMKTYYKGKLASIRHNHPSTLR